MATARPREGSAFAPFPSIFVFFWYFRMQDYFVGIDIGSTSAKTVILDTAGQVVSQFLQPTGYSSVNTADDIKDRLEAESISLAQSWVTATGYGRGAVPYANKSVTEITCHAKGVLALYHLSDTLIIDIGGQDTKIIRLENGLVSDFMMNDKCSAGTGRFLEIMANTLAVTPADLCRLAAHGGGVSISSMCTVFAESEVISLIGRGEKRENIAFAVVDSIIKKVAVQAGRLYRNNEAVCLSGGLCQVPYISQRLAEVLHCQVLSKPEGIYAGALGAAWHGFKEQRP